MDKKSLQETKMLNEQARANSTPDGKSKISLTQGVTGADFSSSINQLELEETKKSNEQSRSKKGFY
jgi:hypothetical protein